MRSRCHAVDDGYLSLRCTLPEDLEEELPSLLVQWPVLGSEIGTRSERGVIVMIFLPGTESGSSRRLAATLEGLGAVDVLIEPVIHEDWMDLYRQRIQAFPVGDRWWIDPHPEAPTAAPAGRQRLAVEPRTAFGSGTHESTCLILLTLEELPVSGAKVLDIGTGSGILALAADNAGAESVVALDIDLHAVFVAQEIAGQQAWDAALGLLAGPVTAIHGPGFDVVLCNMILAEMRPLLGDIRRLLAPGGMAVLSGLLASELDEVGDELRRAGLRLDGERVLGEWASVTATRAENGERL